MARNTSDVRKPVFHAPIRFDWTDERLQSLDQDQLLTLLDNLDYQRGIGRISAEEAGAVELRIAVFLSAASRTRRRKKLAQAAARAAG